MVAVWEPALVWGVEEGARHPAQFTKEANREVEPAVVARERRLIIWLAENPKTIVKSAVRELLRLGSIGDGRRVDVVGGVVAIDGEANIEVPVVAGDVTHRVGVDVGLATVGWVAYAREVQPHARCRSCESACQCTSRTRPRGS